MNGTVAAEQDVQNGQHGHVFAVVYGDEVHVYPACREADARSLYIVGVAAYGDGQGYRLATSDWSAVREKLRSEGIKVVTH